MISHILNKLNNYLFYNRNINRTEKYARYPANTTKQDFPAKGQNLFPDRTGSGLTGGYYHLSGAGFFEYGRPQYQAPDPACL